MINNIPCTTHVQYAWTTQVSLEQWNFNFRRQSLGIITFLKLTLLALILPTRRWFLFRHYWRKYWRYRPQTSLRKKGSKIFDPSAREIGKILIYAEETCDPVRANGRASFHQNFPPLWNVQSERLCRQLECVIPRPPAISVLETRFSLIKTFNCMDISKIWDLFVIFYL